MIESAAGTIKALRDGVSDITTPARASELDGKECGNGVVIAHDQGWETQYCHRQGPSPSKSVTPFRWAMFGKIGLSGRTSFHVHVSVRHNGTRIDPFAPSGRLTCNASADTLWNAT